MAEAHHLALLGKRLLQERLDLVERADLLEHPHHALVGTAVERPLERPDRRHDRGVEPRLGARRDPCREGRGVELVVGVEDEAGVELAHPFAGGLLTAQHVEEVPGDALPGDRLERPLPAPHAVVGGDDGAEPRGQADRLPAVRLVVVHVRVGVVKREPGHDRVEKVHRVDVGREPVEPAEAPGRERHLPVEALVEVGELLPGRQVPEPEQVDDLLERRAPGEVLDRVAPVDERRALDRADRGSARDHALEPAVDRAVVALARGHESPAPARRQPPEHDGPPRPSLTRSPVRGVGGPPESSRPALKRRGDALEPTLDLRLRQPAAAQHHARLALHVANVLEGVAVQEEEIGAHPERHPPELVLLAEVCGGASGPRFEDGVDRETGRHHRLELAWQREAGDAVELRRIGAEQESRARTMEREQHAVPKVCDGGGRARDAQGLCCGSEQAPVGEERRPLAPLGDRRPRQVGKLGACVEVLCTPSADQGLPDVEGRRVPDASLLRQPRKLVHLLRVSVRRLEVAVEVLDRLPHRKRVPESDVLRHVPRQADAHLSRGLGDGVVARLRRRTEDLELVVARRLVLAHLRAGVLGARDGLAVERRRDREECGPEELAGRDPTAELELKRRAEHGPDRRRAVQGIERHDLAERRLLLPGNVRVHFGEPGHQVLAAPVDLHGSVRHRRARGGAEGGDPPVAHDERLPLQHTFAVHGHHVDVREGELHRPGRCADTRNAWERRARGGDVEEREQQARECQAPLRRVRAHRISLPCEPGLPCSDASDHRPSTWCRPQEPTSASGARSTAALDDIPLGAIVVPSELQWARPYVDSMAALMRQINPR